MLDCPMGQIPACEQLSSKAVPQSCQTVLGRSCFTMQSVIMESFACQGGAHRCLPQKVVVGPLVRALRPALSKGSARAPSQGCFLCHMSSAEPSSYLPQTPRYPCGGMAFIQRRMELKRLDRTVLEDERQREKLLCVLTTRNKFC